MGSGLDAFLVLLSGSWMRDSNRRLDRIDLLFGYQFGLARNWWTRKLRGNTLSISGGVEERRSGRIYEKPLMTDAMLCVAGGQGDLTTRVREEGN